MLLPLLLAGNAKDNADVPMMEGIEPLKMQQGTMQTQKLATMGHNCMHIPCSGAETGHNGTSLHVCTGSPIFCHCGQ